MRHALLPTVAVVLLLAACSTSTAPAEQAAPSTSPATAATGAGTEPGTALEHGEAATLVWRPARDLAGEVELSVDGVAEQRRSVFDGWTRDGSTAAARPYFVTVTVANTGESDLGGQDVPLYLRDRGGTLGTPWTVGGDFAACQSGPLPVPFEPGEEVEMCLVYLVPDGGRVRDLVFEPTEGYDPITWSGEVQEPGSPGRAGPKERGSG